MFGSGEDMKKRCVLCRHKKKSGVVVGQSAGGILVSFRFLVQINTKRKMYQSSWFEINSWPKSFEKSLSGGTWRIHRELKQC